MPEVSFVIRWPDGQPETCYSPSTIVYAHFASGARYPMPEFLTRIRAALTAASDRVQDLYGMPCSRALGQLARIEATARTYQAGTDIVFELFKE